MGEDKDAHSDWAEIQQRYWEHLNTIQQRVAGQRASAKPAWEGLYPWWREKKPGTTDLTQHFLKKMMGHGEALFELAEKCSQHQEDGEIDASEVQNAFFRELRQRLLRAKNGQEPLGQVMAFCELPFDFLQQAGAILAPFQVDLVGTPAAPNLDQLQQLLGTPGLGFSREEQALHQDLVKRLLAYQDSLTVYSEFFSDLAMACTSDMEH